MRSLEEWDFYSFPPLLRISIDSGMSMPVFVYTEHVHCLQEIHRVYLR